MLAGILWCVAITFMFIAFTFILSACAPLSLFCCNKWLFFFETEMRIVFQKMFFWCELYFWCNRLESVVCVMSVRLLIGEWNISFFLFLYDYSILAIPDWYTNNNNKDDKDFFQQTITPRKDIHRRFCCSVSETFFFTEFITGSSLSFVNKKAFHFYEQTNKKNCFSPSKQGNDFLFTSLCI